MKLDLSLLEDVVVSRSYSRLTGFDTLIVVVMEERGVSS